MSGPLEIDLPYIHRYRDRHGHERLYFRRSGYPKVALPHPDSERFLEAYRAATRPPGYTPPRPTILAAKGTIAALCLEYTNSADFSQLAASTRREMGYVIDKLHKDHGDKRLIHLERRHILSWKDALAKKPGAANKMLRTLKRMLTFAADRGHLKSNPAAGITMMKLGRYRAWTDAELLAFEARWPIGTLERTGYALAYYTGQRRGDLVRLKWSSIAGGAFKLVQRKTGEPMDIPIHAELKPILAAVRPRREAAILTGRQGTALNDVYFGAIMAAAIEKAGLPDDCVLHGLRKTTGRKLAEAGAKVAPITGHRTERMTAEYSRDASQAKLARASILKWEGRKRKNTR